MHDESTPTLDQGGGASLLGASRSGPSRL